MYINIYPKKADLIELPSLVLPCFSFLIWLKRNARRMQINNHCVFRGKKKWKPFLLPVSCSDLSKSRTWALVLHKIAALRIKATGANKGRSLIVLLPVSVFFEHMHTLVSLYEWGFRCFRFAHFDRFPSLWNSKGYLNLSLTGFTIFERTFWKKWPSQL